MKKRWNAGNAKDQADYERRLMLAYDILLSYPADSGTIPKGSAPQERDERNHTDAGVEPGAGARVVTRNAA